MSLSRVNLWPTRFQQVQDDDLFWKVHRIKQRHPTKNLSTRFRNLLNKRDDMDKRRATSLGKGSSRASSSAAAAARLARTSSWNAGMDGANQTTQSESPAPLSLAAIGKVLRNGLQQQQQQQQVCVTSYFFTINVCSFQKQNKQNFWKK